MRRITARSLENAALFYLRRYPASAARLAQVLSRKARRVNKERGEAVDPAPLIAALVERLTGLGYLDDARLAAQRADAMRRGGRSQRLIRRRLQEKGLGAQAAQVADPAADEEAVWVHARRKRLGPFAPPTVRQARRTQHLAALARAGFSFALSKRVIDAREIPPAADGR